MLMSNVRNLAYCIRVFSLLLISIPIANADEISEKTYKKLYNYSKSGKINKLEALLDDYPNIDLDRPMQIDPDSLTPFIGAAYRGEIDTLALLERRGASVNSVSSNKDNALMWGLKPYKIDGDDVARTVPALLEMGVDVNAANLQGETPLIRAVQNTNLIKQAQKSTNLIQKILQPMMNAGANLDHVDNSGNTAFSHAAALANDHLSIEVLKYLWNQEPNIHGLNNQGDSVLDVLENKNDPRLAELIQEIRVTAVIDRSLRIPSANLGKNVADLNFNSGSEPFLKAGRVTKSKPNFGGLIVKPEGSHKKCYHAIVIGNLTGSTLQGQFSVRLTDGGYQEYARSAGGQFSIPANAGALTHEIWLNKGATIRMSVVSNRGGTWSDLIDFTTDPNCKDGRSDIYGKYFVVELDNNRNRISIFEDEDRDGRRDSEPAVQNQNEVPAAAPACQQLLPLVTRIEPDNSSLTYSDDQLHTMFTAMDCDVPPEAIEQRNRIKLLLDSQR